MTLPVRPFACLLLALALPGSWGAEGARAAARAQDEVLERLLENVERWRDRTPLSTFFEIADLRTEQAFEALLEAFELLESPGALEGAYRAFTELRHEPELGAKAIEYLEDRALRDRPRAKREVAVPALQIFGERAFPSYRRILDASKDESCRALAVVPLLPSLCAEGTLEALETILDNARAGSVNTAPSPLLSFDETQRFPLLLAKLEDRRTSAAWRLFLIEFLGDDPRPQVQPALEKLLKHDSTAIQVAAMRALEARGVIAESEVQLERMRRSPNPRLRIEVIPVLSRLHQGDEEWLRSLLTFASQTRFQDRIAAARGFAALEGREPRAALAGMLSDRSWKVRAAVLDCMREVRHPVFLSPLIDRLEQEDGRMRREVATTLANLTGLWIGESVARWRYWYERNGTGFVPPPVEELPARSVEEAQEGETVGSFYGMPVVSRAATFVLDVSGSMQFAAPGHPDRSRLQDAQDQLVALLGRVPPDSRCNFVFFADDVDVWSSDLRPMDETARRRAIEFVERQEPWGMTNLYGGLATALEDDDVDTIYLLSDGAPTVGEIVDPIRIRKEIEHWNVLEQVQLHCIAVGEHSDLLQNLARDSGGSYVLLEGSPR